MQCAGHTGSLMQGRRTASRWIGKSPAVLMAVVSIALSACGGGDATSSVQAAATASAPTISGTPATTVTSGQSYNFRPTASSSSGTPLSFSVTGLPVWASFSTSTGALTGTPTAAQAGTYAGIVISVNDGTQSTQLPAFSIQVLAKTVSTPPPPPVATATGLYTDLLYAPLNAWVTAYCPDGTKVVNVWNGSAFQACGQSISVTTIPGRVIEVTPSSIAAAVANWQAGDVYYLHAGTYSGVIKSDNWNFASNFDLITSPATAGHPIAIVAYPGEVATLTGAQDRPNFNFANSGGGSKASHMVVAGLNLIGAQECLDAGGSGSGQEAGANDLRFVHNTCTITDTTNNSFTGMVDLAGSNSSVLGNTFINSPNRAIWNNNHAIYVQSGIGNVEVAYNTLVNLKVGHVIQVHQDGTAYPFTNISIHDNLLQAANPGDMRGVSVSNVADTSTVTIANNRLVNLGQDFSAIAIYRGNVQITGNTFTNINAAPDGAVIELAGQFGGSRQVTASGNSISVVNSTPYIYLDTGNGVSASQLTLSGNTYCGDGPPPASDPTGTAGC